MLYFNKLLPVFVLPLGWVVALLVFALLRKRRWPVIAALVALYICSTPALGSALFHALESRYPPVRLDQVEKTDAIVPLGGIFGPAVPAGFLPNLGEGGDRLEAGIELFQRQKADWLVFTGGRLPWAKQGEVEGMQSLRAATARGIPAEKIIVTREVGNTADEAQALRSLMQVRGWQRITLVTSAWHMPRATRQFRKAGVSFVAFPVDYQIDEGLPRTALAFLPSAEGLRYTEMTLRELLGMAFYSLFGK